MPFDTQLVITDIYKCISNYKKLNFTCQTAKVDQYAWEEMIKREYSVTN